MTERIERPTGRPSSQPRRPARTFPNLQSGTSTGSTPARGAGATRFTSTQGSRAPSRGQGSHSSGGAHRRPQGGSRGGSRPPSFPQRDNTVHKIPELGENIRIIPLGG